MTPYNPLIKNSGTITIFHPEHLVDLMDYSANWHIDPLAIGNLVLKHCYGPEFGEYRDNSRMEDIIAEIPDAAVYGIGYIEDYHTKRHAVLSDYISEFFHTLLCEFSRQNQKSMLFKKMQMLKFCQSGVYIYHE